MKSISESWICSEKRVETNESIRGALWLPENGGENLRRLRAVIYNRCSTEEESQRDALQKQIQESKNCVHKQGWELVDAYVEAKSGTTVKGRKEYNRLYQDLGSDKFDIIVIKSQDRLMRNTKDWYLFLDRMLRNQKRLFMYLEYKFYTPDDALITGIKAILAEEYSRELSKKINNAHQNRQREGKRFVLTNRTYGYRKLPDKSIVTEEGEAEMIRMIFNLSAEGYGTHCSAEILYRNGYRNHNGKKLSPSLIRNIIRNPIYKGTIVQNRQHYDFESRQIRKNPPSEWLYHENALPRIVDAELFERANRGLDIRKQNGSRGGKYPKGSRPGKYELSGKLYCGMCGSPFYRTVRRNKSGKVTEWKCSNYLRNGRKDAQMRRDQIRKVKKRQPDAEKQDGCDNVHLDERKLCGVLEQLCGRKNQGAETEKDALLGETMAILRMALNENELSTKRAGLESALDKITGQKNTLLEKLLEGIISDADFTLKNEELESRKAETERELRLLEDAFPQNAGPEARMADIRERLEKGILEQVWTADMVGNISRVEVFPTYMDMYFDSGAWRGLPAERIRVPQTCSTSHRPMAEAEKERIVSIMAGNPRITAREIAGKMEINPSLVHRRIRELKGEGRIRYSSPNGRGQWQILIPSPDSP